MWQKSPKQAQRDELGCGISAGKEQPGVRLLWKVTLHHINKVQDRNKLENGGEVVIIGRKRKGRPAGTTTWSDFRLKVEQV
jgi:hypothetical protein